MPGKKTSMVDFTLTGDWQVCAYHCDTNPGCSGCRKGGFVYGF